jgi:hypothetical protein
VIELVAWVIVLGLAITIAGIYQLSRRIEKHMRELTQIMLHGNDMILAHAKRLADPSVKAPEPIVGVILEKRRVCRRGRVVPISERSGKGEQRMSPGRRWEDFAAIG